MKKQTIFWVASVFLLVPFSQALATAQPGDLIKCPDFATVYVLGEDGQRHGFINKNVFDTHYKDFSEVKEISCDDLASIRLGGNIRYQGGIRLVKTPSIPKVYFVGPDDVLRPIASEEQAIRLFGDDWAGQVDDLVESYLFDYTFGPELDENEIPEGLLTTDGDGNVLRINDKEQAIPIDDFIDNELHDMYLDSAHPLEQLQDDYNRQIEKIDLLINDLLKEIDALLAQLDDLDIADVDLYEGDDDLYFDEYYDEQDPGFLDELGSYAEDAIYRAEQEILSAEDKLAQRRAEGADVSAEESWLDLARERLGDSGVFFEQGDSYASFDDIEEAHNQFFLAEQEAWLAFDYALEAIRGISSDELHDSHIKNELFEHEQEEDGEDFDEEEFWFLLEEFGDNFIDEDIEVFFELFNKFELDDLGDEEGHGEDDGIPVYYPCGSDFDENCEPLEPNYDPIDTGDEEGHGDDGIPDYYPCGSDYDQNCNPLEPNYDPIDTGDEEGHGDDGIPEYQI